MLVHVVVGIDFGVVLLQGVSVHQVPDNQDVFHLENCVAGGVSNGIQSDDVVGERFAKFEQMKVVLVEFNDCFLQIVLGEV